ncbi:MAG: type I restriction-modification system subunit M [Thiotrichaceae bacterium]|nr:type I restriction-modification system subunit M [Thiotrichaceae bacterium]
MNKQQLAAKIWDSANQMRSKIEANEYKDYILGFIFYKYLSDKAIQFAKKEGMSNEDIATLSEDDKESVEYFQKNLGYFIAYQHLFSTWVSIGHDFDVSHVRDALSAFDRLIDKHHKKLFEGIFDTLQTGLSKLGDSSASQTKAINKLIHLIKNIPMDGKQGYDVLGFVYEYLISMFAANAGKKAGEFYTPHEVSLLMSEIVAHHLKDKKELQIYDPTSGSGSLLINIGSSVAKHIDDKNNIKYYAQELTKNTYNLTRMNLVMRGILPNNIVTRNADTLEDDWPYFDDNDPMGSYHPLYADAVVSNPPYSQQWDSENKDTDPRYARFGLAPKTKADYAFLLHDLYHIKPDGIMTIVLPHGVLFRGGEEGAIRKNLIEYNHIDSVIGLPANIFFGTGIPTIILVLKQKRSHTDVLMVDASQQFTKIGKNNKLRASDIKRITDTVIHRESRPHYSTVISRELIRDNDYNLNIPRYVDSSDPAESWDIYASMFGTLPQKEINLLDHYWQAFPALREALFTTLSSEQATLNSDDIKKTITQHEDIKAFIHAYLTAFGDFDQFLKNELLNKMTSLNISKQEAILSQALFTRLEGIVLIDQYEAYQRLDDCWLEIAVDLEIIQSEGFQASKQVDPFMVIKKKKGKDQDVQEGWIGHIMPFELVQTTYLIDELEHLQQNEHRLDEISADYEAILDSLSEEEKEAETIKESHDAFINAVVIKTAKQFRAESKNKVCDPETYEAKIINVDALISEEKTLKKTVKTETETLHLLTKDTIENLSDPQVYELLVCKWINPLVSALNKMPETIINELTDKVQTLGEKYAVTYGDVAEEIHHTEKELSGFIDELTGNEFDMQGLAEFQSFLKGK